MKPRVVIVPGNGCVDVYECNWYSELRDNLISLGIFSDVVLHEMPDPYEAKEEIWIPFMKNNLLIDENTIVIGHSSGSVATMRFLEREKIIGCVLIAACYTDLGEESERISNYYNRPWHWDLIQSNCKWIVQWHSEDDHLIPISEAIFVSNNLHSEFTRFHNRSHFFSYDDVREIPDILKLKISLYVSIVT